MAITGSSKIIVPKPTPYPKNQVPTNGSSSGVGSTS